MDKQSKHNRLYQMLKSSKTKTSSLSNLNDSNSSVASPSIVKNRGGIFNRLFADRMNERRDHRDKLMNQNRAITTPKPIAHSTSNLRSTNATPNAQASKSVLKTLTDTKSSFLSKFPTRKPLVSTLSTETSNANSSINSTYVVNNDLNVSANTSSLGNISQNSSNRKNILEQWRKERKEREMREKMLKNSKPVFKVGSSGNRPPLPAGPALPTSSTFNFQMKLSTPITNLHEKGHGTKKHADIGLGRVTRAQTFTEVSAKPSVKPDLKLTTSSVHLKPTTKPPLASSTASSRPALTPQKYSTMKATPTTKTAAPASSRSTKNTAITVSDSNLLRSKTFNPSTKSVASKATTKAATQLTEDVELITKKIDSSTNLNTDTIEILDSNQSSVNLFICEPKVKNILSHNKNRTSSPIHSPYAGLKSSTGGLTPRVVKIDIALEKSALSQPVTTKTEQPFKLDTNPTVTITMSEEYFESIELHLRDITYYRSLVTYQKNNLTSLIDQWSQLTVPEEHEGDVRLACGLSKLLIDERFTQFSGLITQCEQQQTAPSLPLDNGEEVLYKVHCTDLQGFWDMVENQVKDVMNRFTNLEKLKANNFEPIIETRPLNAKSTAKPAQFKVNRNYLKKVQQPTSTGCQKGELEPAAEVAGKKPKPNKFAEFKAQMKAAVAQKKPSSSTEAEDELIVDIVTAPPKPLATNSAHLNQITDSAAKKGRRKSKFALGNEEQPPATPNVRYNLRSRPSDLIKFDSPLIMATNCGGLETMPEECSAVESSTTAATGPAFAPRKSKGGVGAVNSPMQEEEDKENEDYFGYDRKNIIMWKNNDKFISRLSFLPVIDSPNKLLNIPTHSLVSNSTLTPTRNVDHGRPSIVAANSPLLKLALVCSKSKRLSITQNQVS